jgi:hypothetical protein
MSNQGFTTGTNTIMFSPPAGDRPADPPKGLISTTAVHTRDGWRGQVLIDGEIILESDPFPDGEGAYVPDPDGKRDAVKWANQIVIDRLKRLFVSSSARRKADR